MDYTLIEAFISENALILIPITYILGMFIKTVEFIPDKFIPLLLLFIAIILSYCINGFTVNSFLQGVLCAGVSVFFNQTIKQLIKK